MARRRSISSRRRKANPLAWLLVVALLVGAAYIGAAGKLGTWLAEHVIQPVFVTLGIFSPDKTNAPGTTDAPTVAVSVAGFTVYGLQTGIYSDEGNAQSAAATLTAQGGAGYLRRDGDRMRVFLSVYAGEDEANAVREQLNPTLETRLYPIAAAANTVYVRTDAQAKELRAALADAPAVRTALLAAALNATSDANGPAKVQEAKSALSAFKTKLSQSVPAGQSAFVDALDAACQEALALLTQAETGDARTRSHAAQAACLCLMFGFVDSVAMQ
jgi:hypothetical protein